MRKNSRSKKPSFQLKPACAAVLLAFSVHQAGANPIGGSVISGQAVFNTSGNTLTVTNTPGTIINWQGFSIQQNEITHFAQQSASSAVLNRVITSNPSLILGTLSSNGRVFLVNPSGIVFGAGSTVDVAGMVATSLNLSDADFQAGRLNFSQVSGAQAVSNAGNITAQSGGEIYLIAPNVENSGIITAPNGDILLVAGNSVELVNSNDPNLRVNITAAAGDVTNVGQLVASAGILGLFGTIVKNTGTVSADSATLQGGKIVFRATQRVEAGGSISAQGVGGGEIKVLADMHSGTVNITGTLDASAPVTSPAGGVPGWGNGGFIETSAAHVQVVDAARVSTIALNGQYGTWLIDPQNYTIGAGGDITGATLSANLGLGSITILSSNGGVAGVGDINVNETVSWSGTLLTLTAARDININAVMTASGTSTLALNAATANGADAAVVGGTIRVGMNPNAGGFMGRIDFPGRAGTGIVTINGVGFTVINALGAAGSTTGVDLQGMISGGNYVLGADIVATTTSGWNVGAGFAPLTLGSGKFDGLGHTISDLYIARSGTNGVGLFGTTASGAAIRNVALSNVNITGFNDVGGLVGYATTSTINNSFVSGGTVSGNNVVGGLVGYNYSAAKVDTSYVSGLTVTAGVAGAVGGLIGYNHLNSAIGSSYASSVSVISSGSDVGGLVGANNDHSTITNGSLINTSTVNGSTRVGGLVGHNNFFSTVNNSSATGQVTGSSEVGGLVGNNTYTMDGNTAAAVVNGGSYVGGLVGRNQGALSNSQVLSGTVTGTGDNIGGLVGMNYNGSTINLCSAASTVSGASYVGGLIGSSQQSTLTNVSATGDVTSTNSSAGGLVGSMDGDLSPHSLTNGTASGNVIGVRYVGGLVGWNGYRSSINNGIASGNVTSTDTDPYYSGVGGLVGLNAYTITGSHATGNVTGVSNVGGLVGNNFYDNNPSGLYTYGSVSNSYANTGSVTGTSNVGGLVGHNFIYSASYNNTINNSNAGGAVSGLSNVGGLVGNNDRGSILTSFATGAVTPANANSVSIGGLVGDNSGIITDSYVTAANVTGYMNVGGLVGNNWLYSGYSNSITNSYVSGGSVTGAVSTGGLVGNNTGTLTNSHYNINNVLINGLNTVTLGGLYNDSTANFQGIGQYSDWLLDKTLIIADYTVGSGGSSFGTGGTGIYTISNASNAAAIQGLKDMLGFTDNYLNTFTLTGNVDLASLAGFYVPVMSSSFNGAGFTFSNLSVNLDTANLGLFGVVDSLSTVSNVTLLNATVKSIGPIKGDNIGALAGVNKGTINNSSVSTTNAGNTIVEGGNNVGGLVGNNSGSIYTSSFSANIDGTASVTGNLNVGGLVGAHFGPFLNQSGVSVISNGVVNVSGISDVGGLVGALIGNIDQDYVSSAVITASGQNIGGLAGSNNANIIYGGLKSYFNVDAVTTNGGNNVTAGGLYSGQYIDWYNGGVFTPLVIGNYASLAPQVDGSYGIGDPQGMKDMLGFADYSLNNFSLTASVDLNDPLNPLLGFYVPVLAGSFNGKNFNISNLNINLPKNDMGLFGNINFNSSVVSNLNLVNANVSGNANVGALVGLNYGTIDNVSVTGTSTVSAAFSGPGTPPSGVGGLVGNNNQGNISNSNVVGATVSGNGNVGGLVGYNLGSWSYPSSSSGIVTASTNGIISNSFVSNGTVTGAAGNIGGLVGHNQDGAIFGSHVTNPNVNGGASASVGGLVGYNQGGATWASSSAAYFGNISSSYVSGGTVTSTGNQVGGLAGYLFGSQIAGSWVDSVSVTGGLDVGGLVGFDGGEGFIPHVGHISNSHAINTQVTGGSHVGGLVGYLGILASGTAVNDSKFVVTNSYVSGGTVSSNATNSAASAIGGLVGYNYRSNISGSYVTSGTVVNSGVADSVGGLVGHNIGFGTQYGRIVGSYVNGVVVGTTATTGSVTHVGGLVGFNSGTISNSYVSGGTVGVGTSAALLYNVGGLVGSNNLGAIDTSYVSGGTVSGYSAVGGLAGYNNGTILQSYAASGTVSGFSTAGGLVGYNNFSGNVDNSFWDINTTGLGVGNGFGTDLGYLNTLNVVGLTSVQSKTQADVEAVFGVGTVANVGGAALTWRIYEGHTTPLLSSFLKPLVITADAVSKTYDGSNYNGGLVNPSYTDGVNPVNPNFSDILGFAYGLNAINAGTYSPSLYSGQLGYDISYVGGSLTIGTASLSVISLNGTRVYDGTANVDWSIFNLAGLIGSQTLTLSGIGTLADANVGINKSVSLGTLALGNGTNGGLVSNYTLSGGSYTATITPATLTYTATAANRLYGGVDPNFGGGVTGFVLGESLQTVTTGTAAFTTTAVGASNVGSYAINGSGLTANNGNYSFVQATANATAFTVTPATLTYTANVAIRIYGDADPAFSGTVTGFVLNDNLTNATTGTAAFSAPATLNSNVGSYAINGSGLTANNGNYLFVQDAGNATAYSILQRGIFIVANGVSKMYGSADALTYSVGGSGLAAWDTKATVFTGALSRTAGADVLSSPYAINQGTLAANSNYSITNFTGNDLVITPAPLTVAGIPATKVLGTIDPLLKYTVAGLKYTDTADVALAGTLARDTGETIGSYTVNNGTLALISSNYTYNPTTDYTPCNFTILAPTVVQEITQTILKVGTPKTETAATTEEEDEKLAEEAITTEVATAEGIISGAEVRLPVCR